MSLTEYQKKRSFKKTPEPAGKKASITQPLRFVVQKHDASHLHYDFRLEMEGVLKSWAVPKGPSMDTEVKRLAMMVEDHPYNYRTFEGIIPEGNYGAGTVIVWDEGTYTSAEAEATNKKTQEKNLLHQLYSGKLKFILKGKKLKGEFALIKSSGRGENAWLLMKLNDKYATKEDITKKDKSVQSHKTLAQVEKTSGTYWKSNRTSSTKKSKKEKPAAKEQKELTKPDEPPAAITQYLQKGKQAPFPTGIKPMLATLVTKVFDDKDWLYEIKWDGYRTLAFINNGEVNVTSRNKLSFNKKFPPVFEALQQWKTEIVIDGEIVALNEKGTADFQQLQNYLNTHDANLVYYVFDVLWYKGTDVTQLPLTERKEILKNILPVSEVIRYSDHITETGSAFFDIAIKQGLEGVMAKKCDSTYIINSRTKNWLKMKNNRQMEAIICGYAQGRNSRKYFGSLILGRYEGDELVYIGHTGSGLNDAQLKDVYNKLQPLVTDKCPFKKKPKTQMPATWVKPEYVCEVKFSDWTSDKSLRHPIFLGLREDKKAADEKDEKIIDAPEEADKKPAKKTASKKAVSKKASTTKSKTSAQNPDDVLIAGNQKNETVNINKHELKLTNLDKIFWPEEKITKRDMLNYYYQVMPYLLLYMKDRPQSLNRHPDGINGKSFYQKNMAGKLPGWIKTYNYTSESEGEEKKYFVCTNEASLFYLAMLGCIEMNPWHSRIQHPEKPDWCIIDLDPDNNSFEQVIETALVVKKVLDAVNITAYCKTSGSTGMHIYIPLDAQYTYGQSKLLAELLVNFVHHEIPSFTSVERSPAKRKGKIYLDFLQNRSTQTIAAPYSLRPKPGATVSAPLHWDEVKKDLSIKQFTIYNMPGRLKNTGDIFTPVLGKGIDLNKTLSAINSLMNP